MTTRELAFDVPVAAVRSSDGVNVNVDLVLTLGIGDPVKLVYSITSGDLDEFIHATCQDGVRTLVRGIEALSALDLGAKQAAILQATIDEKLAAYGVSVRAVAFTRVMLPEALTASLEARRLAVIQLAEEHENFVLEQRRVGDRASLIAQEQEARKEAIEIEAGAEALRLAKLEERLGSYPTAARYDLEMARLRVAQQLAGNTRAVVSLGRQRPGLEPAAHPARVGRRGRRRERLDRDGTRPRGEDQVVGARSRANAGRSTERSDR